MKIEKLSKGKFIKTSIIVLIVISIIGVIFINRSKAKYRVTQSIQVVNGEVNYKLADLNVLALYKQKTEGNTNDNNYESITDVPIGSYKVNTDKSYCTTVGNDTKLKNKMTYNNGEISININKKGTKCYVYLDIKVGKSGLDLLAELKVNSTSDGCPAYENTPSITTIEDKNSLLCKGKDDFGDTYYYRGKVTNNWVKFGQASGKDIWWRIIRFNGNNTIRLIYAGTSTDSGDAPAETGSGTQIGTSAFNIKYDENKYVKFVYDNNISSTMKTTLDKWYTQTSNLHTDAQARHIDGTAGFCNDADNGSSSSDVQYYKPHDRIETNKRPTFKCGTPAENLFTTSDGTYGNQKLTNPIGLITVDEVAFAGGTAYNKNYYLYTHQEYYTMSPAFTHAVYYVYTLGYIDAGNAVSFAKGVRPVINLKANTNFKDSGIGTREYPYEVVI